MGARQGVFGAGAHSDYGMLTLLRTDDSPGLQVQPQPGGPWHPVAPKEGAFIINLGDMLERRAPASPAAVFSRTGTAAMTSLQRAVKD